MRAILVPAALLALAACRDAPPDSAGRPRSPPSGVSASLAVLDAAGRAGPFRLDHLARLAIEARCRFPEGGPHAVRVDVVDPGGTLYAQLRGSIEAAADGTGASSHALEVQGTPIEAYRRVGTWRFVLSVDGGEPLASAEVDLTE